MQLRRSSFLEGDQSSKNARKTAVAPAKAVQPPYMRKGVICWVYADRDLRRTMVAQCHEKYCNDFVALTNSTNALFAFATECIQGHVTCSRWTDSEHSTCAYFCFIIIQSGWALQRPIALFIISAPVLIRCCPYAIVA